MVIINKESQKKWRAYRHQVQLIGGRERERERENFIQTTPWWCRNGTVSTAGCPSHPHVEGIWTPLPKRWLTEATAVVTEAAAAVTAGAAAGAAGTVAHYNRQFSVAFSMGEEEQMCGRNRAVRMSFVSLWYGCCCRIKFRSAGRPPRCLLRNTISVWLDVSYQQRFHLSFLYIFFFHIYIFIIIILLSSFLSILSFSFHAFFFLFGNLLMALLTIQLSDMRS